MDSALMVFLKLYAPAICAGVALVSVFLYRSDGSGTLAVFKPFGSFLDIKIPISHSVLVRGLLIVAAGVLLSMYLFLDYAAFFPTQLKMEVFYDNEGLEAAINDLGPGARKTLRIPSNYSEQRDQYFRYLDAEVQKLIPNKSFFSVRGGTVFSTGRTTFVVEKLSGIQHYHVAESAGELSHVLDLPNHPRTEFRTLFQKENTREDFIDFTVADLLLRRSVLIQPSFKQLIAHGAATTTIEFKVTMVTATRVIVLPWPDYTGTVYLADFEDAGRIPIGYAKYK